MSFERTTILEEVLFADRVDRSTEDYETANRRLRERIANTNRRMNNNEHRIKQTEDRLERANAEFRNRISRQDNEVARLNKTLIDNNERFSKQYGRMRNSMREMTKRQQAEHAEAMSKMQRNYDEYLKNKENVDSEMNSVRHNMHNVNGRIDANQRANVRRYRELQASQIRMRAELSQMVEDSNRQSLERDEALQRDMMQMRTDLVSAINETRSELQSNINAIQKNLNEYIEHNVAQENRRMRTAEIWEQTVQNSLDFLATFNHEVLAPHKLEALRMRFENSKQFKNSDNIQVFTGQMVDLYRDVNELHLDLLEAEAEWNDLFSDVESRLSDVITKNNTLNGISFSMPYSSKAVEGRINYWTDGQFDKLKERLRPINDRLYREKQLISGGKKVSMTIQELKLMRNELDALDREYDTLETVAKRRIVASDQRRQCFQRIATSLIKDHGFKQITESDCGFKDGEEKNDFVALFAATNGDKISIVISDAPSHDGTYQVETFVHDKENDPKIHEMYGQIVYDALNIPNTRVQPSKCHGDGYASEERRLEDEAIMRDVKAVVTKKESK